MSTNEEFDIWYEEYKAEEFQRLNGGILCRAMARLAFSRWRRALLNVSLRMPRRKRFGIDWDFWHDRMLDALYPDDCVITFK